MLISLLVVIIALLHLYFFLLESYLYSSKKGQQVFNLSAEQITHTKVLAFNQGYYNLCLALSLYAALALQNISMLIILLLFVMVVGIVGGLTFAKKIFWVQAFPALITLLIILSSHLWF